MTVPRDLFQKINDCVLDLQAANFQSYPVPVKRLCRILLVDDFSRYREELTAKVNLEDFLTASEASQGGMIGSAELAWPENDDEILALKLLLILKFGEDPNFMASFGYRYLYSGSTKLISGVRSVTSQIISTFVRDFKAYVEAHGMTRMELKVAISNRVFIVHGHDAEAREMVARFISNIGLEPVILNEQANQGRTIIEKIVANSDVGFAVVMLTPDDVGRAVSQDELEPRARQNVLIELGYFLGYLGRDKVCALKRGDVDVPSDFAGVVWENFDQDGGWKLKLARELIAAGHLIDMSKAV